MALGKLGSYITLVSGPFHPFGGAIDIVVVQQPDGTFKTSPWYVRFGKFQGVLKSREKIVNISVNGDDAAFCMYLDHKGEAFFLHDADTGTEGECSAVDFAMSPVSSGDERENKMETNKHEGQSLSMQENESCQENMDQSNEIAEKSDRDENGQLNTSQIGVKGGMEGSENSNVNGGQMVKKTGSKRATILQLMFGRRSSKDKHTAGVERINSLERAEMAADLMEMKWSTNLSVRDRTGLESDAENLKVQDENSVTGESANVNVAEQEVKVQTSDAGRVSLNLQDCTRPVGEEVDVPVVELDSGNEGCQEETSVKTDETVQSSEAATVGLDLQDSTLAEEEEVDVLVVELDSGNVRNQEESLVNADEIVAIRTVEVGVIVQPMEAGNAHLDWHGSEEAGCGVVEFDSSNLKGRDEISAEIEFDSSNLKGRDEISAENCEPANLIVPEEVIQVQLTDSCCTGLDSYQSAVSEKEEVRFNVVESDSYNSGFHNEILIKTTESVNARATGQVVEVPSSEAGNAGLDLHDSVAIVSEETDAVVRFGSAHASSLSDGTIYEVYVREANAHSSSSGEDQILVGTSLKEVVNIVPQCVIIEEEIKGVIIADLDSHERSLTATGENVFSDCMGAVSFSVEKEDAVENGAREINQVVAFDSLKSYKQAHFDGPWKKNVLQGSASEANPRSVTVNSDFTNMLESCSSTVSVETSSEDPLNKVLEGSSGDVLPEKMNMSLDEQQQNEKFQVQKMEVTDHPVGTSNLELSSLTAVFDKSGDNINQYLLSDDCSKTQQSVSLLTNEPESTSLLTPNSSGLKDEKSIYGFSVPENKEELQFDFSDDESAADYENKIEIINMATVSTNENVTLENDIEEAVASDSESCSETNPISIPGTNNTRNESMARSLPNIQFDKIEQIERLSSSLETVEVQKEKGSLSTVPNGDSQCSSSPNQIKSETGTVHHGTILDVPDDKSATINPFIEMSLCKHMLSEGMGEEAARLAFDSQKLTLEKFRELGPPNLIKNDKLVVRIGGLYFPYEVAAPVVLGMVSFGGTAKELLNLTGMIKVDQVDPTKSIVRAGGSWRLWPFGFKRSKTISTLNVAEEVLDSNFKESEGSDGTSGRKKVRSLVPTSEEIGSLCLKEGRNIITFTFSTSMLGKQQVDARIFLWKWNTRIVISDVDGTITRSDVLGQFMPLVGVDWSQTGVAHLFSGIKDNGYQLLFLSARAISQAHLTRQFLCSLKQDGKALPEGPVVISPDGLFPSLYREVIRRAPHEFKISCLEAIKALFPVDCNPFYAGFGNRDTDEISYLKVGVPMGKIFIINPKGEVAVHRRVDTKSYSSLHELVNRMFPPYSSQEQEGFNDINFWRLPLPALDL